jgi:hypothetical protein
MRHRVLKKLLVAGFVLGAVAGPSGYASAQGTTTAFDGFNPEDPFGSAAREIIRVVRRQCGIGDERLVVGVASETSDNQQLTKDQSNNIMLQVHGAFSKVDNIGLVNFSDVGALDDLDRAGLLKSASAGNVRDNVGQANLVVRAVTFKSGRALRFALKANHTQRQACEIQLTPIEIPSRLIGDVFLTPNVIFDRLAGAMWRQTSDRKFYAFRNGPGSGYSDPQMSEYFAQLTRSAISGAKDENADLRGKSLVPTTTPDDPDKRGNTWIVQASLVPFNSAYRLQLDAEIPNEKHVAQEGLVVPSDLPSRRRSELQRQASIIRQPPPSPSRQGQGAQRTQRSAGEAAVISITSTPTRIQDTVDDQTSEQRYYFELFRESFVEFDVVKTSGRQIAFKPELFGANGMPVDAFPPGRARVNLRRYRLPPGAYEMRVTPEERGRHDFVVATRAASTSSMLDFEPIGRLTRRFNDWFAGERQIGGSRVCFAYTQATDVSPNGWREQRPYIWIAINGDPKIQEIGHFIDDATRYSDRDDPKVSFEDQGGTSRPLTTKVLGGTIQPAIANARGEAILDRESVRGYTQGASIRVSGTTPDGKPAEVRYSLIGYRSAINAAALNCGRPDLAQDLVWRR